MTTATANATASYPTPDIAAAVARALAAARDRPQPILDANRSAQKYAGMAQDFRTKAWEHLDQDDLAQASNKAWGLVAETVKAISAHHGGFIHTHRRHCRSGWRAGPAGRQRRRYGNPKLDQRRLSDRQQTP